MSQMCAIDALLKECLSSFVQIDNSVQEYHKSNIQSISVRDQSDNDITINQRMININKGNKLYKSSTKQNAHGNCMTNRCDKMGNNNNHDLNNKQIYFYSTNKKPKKEKDKNQTINEIPYCLLQQKQIHNNDSTISTRNTNATIGVPNLNSTHIKQQSLGNYSRNKSDINSHSALSQKKSCQKHKSNLKKTSYQSISIYSPYHLKNSFEMDKTKDVSTFVNLYEKNLKKVKDKNKNIRNRKNENEILRQIEYNKHCTFTPLISKSSEISTTRSKKTSSSDFLIKVNDFNKLKETKRYELKQSLQNVRNKDYTYHPVINRTIRKNDIIRIMMQIPFINDYALTLRSFRNSKNKDKIKTSSPLNVSSRQYPTSRESTSRKSAQKKNVYYYRSQSMKSINDSRSHLGIEDFYSNSSNI